MRRARHCDYPEWAGALPVRSGSLSLVIVVDDNLRIERGNSGWRPWFLPAFVDVEPISRAAR